MNNKKSYQYEGMTNKQIDVLNKFTQFRSATIFQKRLTEIIGENELVKDWVYDGYRDTGYFGGDKCSMGHTLRYVHITRNIKTGERIKFGVKCISDFFNITVDKLKMLQEGFIQVNKMANNIVEKFREGNYNFKEMEDKLSVLEEKPEHYENIIALLNVKLPLPWQYDNEVNKIWMKEYSSKEFQKFLDENPKYIGIVVMAQLFKSDDSFKKNHPLLHEKMDDIVKFLNKNKRLSEKQIELLNKIMMMDFDTIDSQIKDLSQLNENDFLRIGDYNEYNTFRSLVDQYNTWGLSEKQIGLINKIYNRCLKKINLNRKYELLMVE